MAVRDLPLPSGFDASTQSMLGLFAAQLDDQTRNLKKAIAEFEPRHLEWQIRPGQNTVGMLLAHIAVAEGYWMNVAAQQIPLQERGEQIIVDLIGIRMDDDGLPLGPDGLHPATLKGKSLGDYLTMIDKARAATHIVLKSWTDAKLTETLTTPRGTVISYGWIAYHILEHLAGHYGQILLLRHFMRSEGLLPMPVEEN